MISSADFSRVCTDKPLFSPVPGQQSSQYSLGKMKPGYSMASIDSLAPQEYLVNSLLTNSTEQYSYDWSANKDKYTLLFDKASNKASDDEDCQENQRMSLYGSMTNWQHHSTISAPVRSDTVKTEPIYKRQQSLTSWGAMKKEQKTSENVKDSLTSWKNLHESQTKLSCVDSIDGDKNDIKSVEVSDQSVCMEDPYKRHSGTLLQIYQRLKSPDAAEVIADMENSDVPISPSTMNRMIGTWSVSPCSEKSQLWDSQSTADNDMPLTSWNTIKNLTSSQQMRMCDSISGQSYLNSTTASETSYQLEQTPPAPGRSISRDACVQTSVISDAGKKENKSLQTSLLMQRSRSEVKENVKRRPRARSLDDSVGEMTNSLGQVFYPNATLPDLSFLNQISEPNTKLVEKEPVDLVKRFENSLSFSNNSENISEVSPKIMRSNKVSTTYKKPVGIKTGLPSRPKVALPTVERLRQKNCYSSAGSSSSTSSGIDAGFSESPPNISMNQPMKKREKKQHCLFNEYRTKSVNVPEQIVEMCPCCKATMYERDTKQAMTQSQPMFPNNDLLYSHQAPGSNNHWIHNLSETHCCSHMAPRKITMADYSRRMLKKPLKSCLVKRRKSSRGMAKHRSFSDPYDLAVMKQSIEGQARLDV